MRTHRISSRAGLFGAVSLLYTAAALAQPAYRVRDIATGAAGSRVSFTGAFGEAGSTVVFGARGAATQELWKSDGTSGGTGLLKTLHAEWGSPFGFVRLGGVLCFLSDQGELWRTDGTAEGTNLVADVGVDQYSSPFLAATKQAIFFSADDGEHGSEPWTSDGTTEGTRMLADLSPGAAASLPQGFVARGSRVYFFAFDDDQYSLWKSDGSPSGTVRVKALGRDQESAYWPYGPAIASDGRLLFFLAQSQGIYRLWISDGTEGGTDPIGEFVANWPGVCGVCVPIGPSDITALDDTTLFLANDGEHGRELWRTDGTAPGTRLVRDIFPGGEGSSWPGLVRAGNLAYFTPDDGVHGTELWRTDGTEQGTTLLLDLGPGSASSYVRASAAFQGKLYFGAWDGSRDRGLWVTDGTPTGTFAVSDSVQGVETFMPASDALFFAASDGESTSLWKTDGSAAGTERMDRSLAGASSNPMLLTNSGGRLFFVRPGDGVSPPALWVSDGTEAGTHPVSDAFTGIGTFFSGSLGLGAADGNLYFAAADGSHGTEPWKSDGSAGGTVMIKDIATPTPQGLGVVDSSPFGFTAFAGAIYFGAYDADHGYRLWRTDGTEAGTVPVSPVTPLADTPPFVVSGGWLYFVGYDEAHGMELWRSDGTEEGTTLVVDLTPGPDWSGIYNLVPVADRVIFSAPQGGAFGVWVSDGTASGTHALPGAGDLGNEMVAAGDLVYFTDWARTRLWRTDGSDAGTYPIASIAVYQLTSMGSTLLFVGDDGVSGAELWKTDGTSSGTSIVSDIRPGPAGSRPSGVARIGDLVLFGATDEAHGSELWAGDGTAQGTFMIQDIAPGPESSSPSRFARSGEHVFFTADDGLTGVELWAIPAAALRPQQPRDIEPASRTAPPTHTLPPRP